MYEHTKTRLIVTLFLFSLLGSENIYSQREMNCDYLSQYREVAIAVLKEELLKESKIELTLKMTKTHNLSIADTSNMSINIPIICLNSPELEENKINDYSSLELLLNFEVDPYTQYIIIEKEDGYVVMSTYRGLNKRWFEHTKKLVQEGNLDDVKIIPSDWIIWTHNANFSYKYFDYNTLKAYIERNPEALVFSIYKLNGLWAIKEGKFIRIDFSKKGIVELDAEEWYKTKIIYKGLDGIKHVIIGASPERVICI